MLRTESGVYTVVASEHSLRAINSVTQLDFHQVRCASYTAGFGGVHAPDAPGAQARLETVS